MVVPGEEGTKLKKRYPSFLSCLQESWSISDHIARSTVHMIFLRSVTEAETMPCCLSTKRSDNSGSKDAEYKLSRRDMRRRISGR